MPVDENTRLRIRQYLIELMDEQAADAMMESMPPIPWTQLATKDDVARLGTRLEEVNSSLAARIDTLDMRTESLSGRMDSLSDRMDSLSDRMDSVSGRMDSLSGRMDSLSDRMDSVSGRMDSIGDRMDSLGAHMSELARAVTIGAVTMAVMLAVFIVGTTASLIAAGAMG